MLAREFPVSLPPLVCGRGQVHRFLTSAKQYIEECRTLIQTTSNKDNNVIASLFRNIHTVKGNAEHLGSHITDSVHNVENTYDELRKDRKSSGNPPFYWTGWPRLKPMCYVMSASRLKAG